MNQRVVGLIVSMLFLTLKCHPSVEFEQSYDDSVVTHKLSQDDGDEYESDYPINIKAMDNSIYQSDSDQTPQLNDQIHRLKKCGKYDFCEGRSEDSLKAPLLSQTHPWDKTKCYCDSECSRYGDCCIDKAGFDKNSLLNGYQRQYWGCIPLTNTMGVYGLVRCEGSLSHLCLKTNSSEMHSDIAVYSSKSGIVFANVYCALCHGVPPSDIVYSDVNIRCDNNLTIHQLNRMNYSNLHYTYRRNCKAGLKTSMCKTEECLVELSGIPGNNRQCRPAIRTCSPGLAEDQNACQAYSLPVIDHNDGKVYQNAHCAVCSGVELRSLRCSNLLTVRFKSMNVIMDINWDFNKCQLPSTIWDGRVRNCVQLNCLDGYCNADVSYSKESIEDVVEGYLTAAVLVTSIGFLLVHNIIYYLEPKRQNVPSQVLKSLSWSLIFGHLSFLIIDMKDRFPFVACKFVGFSIQFFYLSSFFWMNVMSFDVWRTFSKVTLRGSSSSTIRKYNWYTWGCSSLIVGLTVLFDLTRFLPVNFRPNVGLLEICWFSSGLSFALYFFVPSMILLLSNLFLFGKTVYWFQNQTSKEFEKVNNEATGRKEYLKVWLYIKLCVIMGLTWLICVLSNLTENHTLRYIFIILNGLQGAFIFIMFDLKKRIFHQVFDKFSRTNSTTTTDVKQSQTVITRNDKETTYLNSKPPSLKVTLK